MTTLNSAEEILALKHSVKKKMAQYIIKKVKVCVSMHKGIWRYSYIVRVIFNSGTVWVRGVTFTFFLLLLGKSASGARFLSGQLEEQINLFILQELELHFIVFQNRSPLITSTIAGLYPQSPSNFAW